MKVYNSNSAASATTDYFFEFKSGVYFPAESYLLISLDPGSGFPYTAAGSITCSAIQVNTFLVDATFVCTRISSTQIKVTGFNTFVSAGDEIGITMQLSNPSYSQTTGNFTIAAFRYGTSYAYSIRDDIPGIYIAPGGYATASVAPAYASAILAKQKRMDYVFSFDPNSVLTSLMTIYIDIPTGFTLV